MSKRTSIAVATAIIAAMVSPIATLAQSNEKWQGFYAGINAGGLWSSTSASIVENNAVAA